MSYNQAIWEAKIFIITLIDSFVYKEGNQFKYFPSLHRSIYLPHSDSCLKWKLRSHIFLMECPNNGYKYSICTLTIMYKLFMHSLSLFKIVAPKAINKILHQYDFPISISPPLHPYLSAIKDQIEHTNVPSIPIELLDHPIHIPF